MLACAAPTLRGGTSDRRPAERWDRRALGVVAVALALMWVVMPVGVAMFAAGKPRSDVPAGSSAGRRALRPRAPPAARWVQVAAGTGPVEAASRRP